MAGSGRNERRTSARAPGAAQRVAVLEQALWKALSEAASLETLAPAWLALQCRAVPNATGGLIVLGEPEIGPFAPVAVWPDASRPNEPSLSAAADRAIAEKRGVIVGPSPDDAAADRHASAIAHPVIVDGHVHGAVALEIGEVAGTALRAAMRELQWGIAWIRERIRAADRDTHRRRLDRATLGLDLIATAVETERYAMAAVGAVTEMAHALGCQRVAIGFRRYGHTRVAAVSQTARLRERMNLIRGIGAAMDEAIDQGMAIVHPAANDDAFLVTVAHAALVRDHGMGTLVTVPFAVGEDTLGAIMYERGGDEVLDQATVELMDGLTAAVGPVLAAKRREDRPLVFKAADAARTQIARLLGPRYHGRKLAAVSVLALAALMTFATQPYRVSATARLEGLVRRVVVAPFDGYILDESARAGDKVKKGQILASIDDHDLALERLRRMSERAQRLAEYQKALAERKAATVNVIKAQLDQASAEIALLDDQIARAKLRAPFDGLVVSGDLSESVGASVERGKELFEVAPLSSYRVIVDVEDRDIDEVRTGQKGMVLMSSLPDVPIPFTVETITPVAEAHEGRMVFRVEGRLDRVTDRVRPGMRGVAKIDVDERRIAWIWTHKLVDWTRLRLWAWLP